MKRAFGIAAVSVLACASLLSCSKDLEEPLSVETKVFEGDEAFLRVVVTDAGVKTRAVVSDKNNGFEYGDEHDVSSADFYFYNASGVYVTNASVWKDGNEVKEGTIEYDSPTLILLKGLTGKSVPKYMVTVLNKPESFSPASSLEGFASLTSYDPVASTVIDGGIYNGENFIMSTSSFYSGEDVPAYVSVVEYENFTPDSAEADEMDPVDVYVERLAAKVTLSIAEGLSETATSNGLYELVVPTEGSDNGDETYYVKLIGWKLNATAKYSRIVKDIDASWTADALGFAWNDADNFRSYWGKSYNYGLLINYPLSSDGVTDTTLDDTSTDGTSLNPYLNYVSLSDDGNAFGTPEYCAENTNTVYSDGGVIDTRYSSAITSVLVKARLCNEDGTPCGDLVLFENMLWSTENYISYIFSYMSEGGLLGYYLSDGTDGYTQMSTDLVELVSRDGFVYLDLTEDAMKNTFYTIEYGEDGKPSTTKEVSAEDVRKVFVDFATDQYMGSEEAATGYKDGLMYYDIPIEHLNNNYEDTDEAGNTVVLEANYGVVRNHSYSISIVGLGSLGRGIFNPDEVIIPQTDLDKYYLSAEVTILPWRVHTFDLEL